MKYEGGNIKYTTLLIESDVLVSGEAEGPLLRLDRSISFWGGIDPKTGDIIDPRHPQFGQNIGGKILAMERVVGSSSGSSVLLELIAIGHGPAGLILTETDAIAVLGVVVARVMGYGCIPVLRIEPSQLECLPDHISISLNGHISNISTIPAIV